MRRAGRSGADKEERGTERAGGRRRGGVRAPGALSRWDGAGGQLSDFFVAAGRGGLRGGGERAGGTRGTRNGGLGRMHG